MTDDALDALLHYVRDDGRICPKPPLWNELWSLLPCRECQGTGWNPPPPLILAAWHHSSDNEKADRLALHIRHAHANAAFADIDRFLRRLDQDDWVYRGER